MEILLFLAYKFFVFTFILAILYVARELFKFVRGLNTGEYKAGKYTALWIGICIAHILTMLITGFIIY